MGFRIDRMAKSCHTPRRNDDIEDALRFHENFCRWFGNVQSFFERTLFPVQSGHSLDLSAINSNGVFVPVLPLFEDVEAAGRKGGKSGGEIESEEGRSGKEEKKGDVLLVVEEDRGSVVPLSYINPFLSEQLRSLNEKIGIMAKVFPANEGVITAAEGRLVIAAIHGQDICMVC
jgi:hypothetical protein